MSVL
ncbi:bd632811-5405-4a67-b47d-edb19bb5df05 [Thermothielavioides terrestris]|jgi:hypothetical protein